jgi:hypothetical protein
MERLRGPDCEAETVSIMNSESDRKNLNPRAISHVLFSFVEAQQRRFITSLSSFFLLISISNRNCDRVRSSLGGDPSSLSRQTAIAFLDAIGDRTTARASPSTPRSAGRAHSLTREHTLDSDRSALDTSAADQNANALRRSDSTTSDHSQSASLPNHFAITTDDIAVGLVPSPDEALRDVAKPVPTTCQA